MALTSVSSGGLKGELDRSLSRSSIGQTEARNKLDVTGGGSSLPLTGTTTAVACVGASLVQTATAGGTGDDKLRGGNPCGGGGGDEKSKSRANNGKSHPVAVPGCGREKSVTSNSQPRERNKNNRRPPDTPRKSLVNRQTESLGWATKPARDTAAASTVAVRPHRMLPLRNGTPGRRRASSPSTAHSSLPDVLMPSSASGTFFGSFDDSRYWDYAFRFTLKGDMGHHCRECKRPFSVLNEAIAVRRSENCANVLGDFPPRG